MNKFSAEDFFHIAQSLARISESLKEGHEQYDQEMFPDELREGYTRLMTGVMGLCNRIGLKQSGKAADRLNAKMERGIDFVTLRISVNNLRDLIKSEIESELFVWVPNHRSEWFEKDAEAIMGLECCQRFPSIQREVEDAAKCFAFGQYTAAAFHLCRSTEVGLKAIAKAINYIPQNDHWTLVFEEFGRQAELDPSLRLPPWPTHEKFFEIVWDNLKAVSKAWRNDICHLVDCYSEPEAKELLTVIPMFLRKMAAQMDETGKLYWYH